MDTGKEYIKMCEKAYKYLKKPSPLGHTNLWHEKNKSNMASAFLLSNEGDERYFPIYRQDQLQGMIGSYEAITDMLTDYSDFHSPPLVQPVDEFTSMEQLWLAFVMKEKHNKTWDGEDWEKI